MSIVFDISGLAIPILILCGIGLIWIGIQFYKMIKEIWGKK